MMIPTGFFQFSRITVTPVTISSWVIFIYTGEKVYIQAKKLTSISFVLSWICQQS